MCHEAGADLPAARRLAVEDGRLLKWRPAVVAGSLLARFARLRGYTLWPAAEQPMFMVDVGYPPAAAWLRATFEPRARRQQFPAPATWNALRARGLLIGPPSGLVLEAAERALERPLRKARLLIYSAAGEAYMKATCFLFEEGQPAPSVVVKMMPVRRFAPRLRSETEFVETLRSRLAGAPEQVGAAKLVEALPLAPLYVGEVGGDFVVTQPLDPLAVATGKADRSTALAWLRAFQAATDVGPRPWTVTDEERELELVRYAWHRARPEHEGAIVARVAELLAPLRGAIVSRCAVHGDFFGGNIAFGEGQFRVYDWEWAETEGWPFLDLWIFELGELDGAARRGEPDLVAALGASLERVRDELGARGHDPRFALALLAPVAGLIAFRAKRVAGVDASVELNAARVMATVEELLLSGRSGYRSP
jgi:hypothetical protein